MLYCSGCSSLVQLQYDELCAYAATQLATARNGSIGPQQCAICAVGHACFAGLSVLDDGAVTLTDELLAGHPFGRFEQARTWGMDREQHFACGEVCGNGWCKRPGVNKCKLHTGPVSPDELLAYWSTLPGPRREALMTLDEETFLGELDVSMKLQLRICKECRSNVTRAFKELKPGRDASGQPSAVAGLLLCEGHELRAGEGRVRVEGPGEACLFEKAEEVQEQKAFDAGAGDQDSPETIRHAETPELAREALQDSALLIFKAQVEVAFRDQTACRNALLLFTVLCHGLLEQQLANAYKELGAKRAEAELLRLLEEDEAKEAARREKKAMKAAKAKKQQPGAVAGVPSDAAHDQQPSSDSDEPEPEPKASVLPLKDAKESAPAPAPAAVAGGAAGGAKSAAQEKSRECSNSTTPVGVSNTGGKQAVAPKHQQQSTTGRQSRASSLDDSTAEALAPSSGSSGRGPKQQAAHSQQNGVPQPASAKSGAKAQAAAPVVSAKPKEPEQTAAGKDKGQKTKEAAVGTSAGPAAAATAGKGAKAAADSSSSSPNQRRLLQLG
ncbi:hypothetical protein GPECTOR_34g786 [Gonium pectorale]|uniref:Uncharacterized protein n=1 Tax=Gonium pectorale TaxID=33097 RepID=A0A150GCQ9_GONPE|nr:hypothetical protein GPECTOR_34g786 [Gonium pectorale]|eukprot:KXZ47627.1 hypothetical protein GPECTOR_34g786 [Gonium pectorale]